MVYVPRSSRRRYALTFEYRQPFPDVVSTSGAHLVTQPNTPATLRPPLDTHDLIVRLHGLLHRDAIRREKYGDKIADKFRICHTPIEARKQYEEARRKAQEEWDNYVPSDTEDEEEDRKTLPAQPRSRIKHALPTPEKEADSGAKPSRLQRLESGNKLDTVIHVQQPAGAVAAVTVSKVGLLSPPARPKKRKAPAIEDKENEADTPDHRTKRKRTSASMG